MAARDRSRSPRALDTPSELRDIKALVVNLDRRPDRWARCEEMLKKETPWLQYERFSASDGSKMQIPEAEVCSIWNTKKNAKYGDYDEWVYDAPGTELEGQHWKWADGCGSDEVWTFEEAEDDDAKATARKIATGETFQVKRVFAKRFEDPGQTQRMSGGERGCAHSHRRIWQAAVERREPTLVLEDDVQFVFGRSGDMGEFSGALFTERLAKSLREAPEDFDVLYCGWSGHRGGNFKLLQEEDQGEYIRKVEYVWTTVAYVLSQAGARKLLHCGSPIDQPVDNFMAWEASQGRLKSFVALDEGDDDGLWAGGICDQVDFQGDSDIKKSDGGVQGDDHKEFAVPSGAAGEQVAQACGA